MDRLRAMEMFVEIVRRNGFARAAEALDTSPANVTRYLNDLEAHLGTPLLNRSSRRMSLTVRREDDHLVLEVVDDGVGFTPSERSDDAGFGLRAAESLVREHGGTMEVESTPGSGTIVRVEVPLT